LQLQGDGRGDFGDFGVGEVSFPGEEVEPEVAAVGATHGAGSADV